MSNHDLPIALREFETENVNSVMALNQVWVGDITYIATEEGWSLLKDLIMLSVDKMAQKDRDDVHCENHDSYLKGKLALRQFHIEMLEQAAGSISRVPSDQRMLLSHTMAISKGREPELFKILKETIEKISAMGAGEGENDEVYHIEFAAFPLTKKASIPYPSAKL